MMKWLSDELKEVKTNINPEGEGTNFEGLHKQNKYSHENYLNLEYFEHKIEMADKFEQK